ncbi:MAG: FtsX-like permease family protein [Candidatus Hodarchaeota archaeon]
MSRNSGSPVSASNLTGSRWYIASYVGNSIRKHKARSLSLLLGMVIGIALVSSVFVWTDTGTRVAIDDYFEGNIYQYNVFQRVSGQPRLVFDVQDWFRSQSIYKDSHVVYHSVGILNGTELSESTLYYPYPYANGIKDLQTFFVQDSFLEIFHSKLNITGTYAVTPGTCLISARAVADAEAVLNQTITIGSIIDIAVASINVETSEPSDIGDINRFNITQVQVIGIYSLPPEDTVLYSAFDGMGRTNYVGSGLEQVFGWNDGIIFHYNQIDDGTRDTLTVNTVYPRLLVRLDSAELLTYGLDRVPQIIRALKEQAEVEFQNAISVFGERQLLFLEEYIAAYRSRQTMAVLVAPVIILSIFLTTFATNIFLSGRRAEVAILRARGASFYQLYAAFILEFITIGIVALCLGMVISLFVGSLIPASIGFLQFDLTIFNRFFSVVRLEPLTWIIATISCLVPPLVFTMIYVRSFLRTEIYRAMVGINPPGESDLVVTILYFIGCLALLGFFYVAIIWIPATPMVAILQFIYAVVIWTLLSDSGSRIVRRGVAGITRGFRPIFGERAFIFEKSMRTRRERIVPLLLILTLTFSVTIFAVVEAQTVQINANRQIEYFIGADLRIQSDIVPSNRIAEVLAIPGIEKATPLIRTWGLIGTISFAIYGIDVDALIEIGKWDPSSIIGADPYTVLQNLQNDPTGIIFPHTLAERLGRGVGEGLPVIVYEQGGGIAEEFPFRIVGLGFSTPGLGYFDPEDPSRPIDTTNGFQFQESQPYALVNLSYLTGLNMTNMQLILASINDHATIEEVQTNVLALGFPTKVHSPSTFSLEEAYPDGYLFNRGVISILSIGFLACLVISIIALTLFVGVIVTERQTEYAIMRAVGSTRRQIISIVVGEFIGLILVSFLVAMFLGFIFSWLLMNVLLSLFPFPFVVPFQLGIPFLLLIFVLAIVLVGMSIGTYIPARRAGRTNVGRVLRNL